MPKLLLILFLAALGQLSRATTVGTAPDGRWTIQTTTHQSCPAIAIFNSDDRPAVIVDRDTTGTKRVAASWSPDSKKVILLAQAPLGSGITVGWFDGAKWHAVAEPDDDIRQADALARTQGLHAEVKAEERELGAWISPDTVQIHGTLRYVDGREFGYSYRLQIVPGSYLVNRGGFETGGLKASGFQAGSTRADTGSP